MMNTATVCISNLKGLVSSTQEYVLPCWERNTSYSYDNMTVNFIE